jgi:hypothetical protein
MLLVKYRDHDTIEGYVKSEEAFDKWLDEYNHKRKQVGELEEHKHEFDLIEIEELI